MQWRENAVRYEKIEDKIKSGRRPIRFTARVPEHSSVDKNVLLVPGILAEQHALNPLAKALAEIGITSITMDDPAHSDDVLYLMWEIEARLHERTTLAGHSLGGIHVLEAAQWAQHGTDVLLMQSAGFRGVRTLHALESIQTDRPDNSHFRHELKVVRSGLGYAIRHAREMPDLIHKAESGIGIELGKQLPAWMGKRALLFANDRLVLSDPAMEGLIESGFTVSMLPNRLAGHNAPMYLSREVADAVSVMVRDEAEEYVEAA